MTQGHNDKDFVHIGGTAAAGNSWSPPTQGDDHGRDSRRCTEKLEG